MAYDLYVITDEALAGGRSHAEIASRAVAGGADVIQLRDKTAGCRTLTRTGREIRAITARSGAIFIVNDRLDVALACGADGVHLGQGDTGAATARQLAPLHFIIGVSVGNVEEALRAEAEGADYVALSPLFPTTSKAGAGPGFGLEELRKIRRAVKIPVLAIGGIGPGNVRDVIRAGADGVAVISAVVAAPDITGAARNMKRIIRQAKREQGR